MTSMNGCILRTSSRKPFFQEALVCLDPVPKQLMRFYVNTLQGDFGESRRIQRNTPVLELIASRVKISMRNGAMALGIALTLGVCIGVFQTLCKDKLFDHIGTGYTVFVNAVPTIVSYSLILVFGSKVLGLPSLYSSRRPFISNIMPVFCLAMMSIAGYALWTRRYMVDELNKDYIKMARVKGLSSRQIMFHHVLKNAFVPLVQYLPTSLLNTIGGSLLVERFFSVPGMGTFLADAITCYAISTLSRRCLCCMQHWGSSWCIFRRCFNDRFRPQDFFCPSERRGADDERGCRVVLFCNTLGRGCQSALVIRIIPLGDL